MITRRRFLRLLIVASVLSVPFATLAQRRRERVARIGWLSPVAAQDQPDRLDAFRAGLRKLGYVEGKNVVLELRWAEGRYERLSSLASELVQAGVDVIVTSSTPAIQAAKQATSTIPIVMASVAGDPIASGFVASLARPGGNITGLTSISADISSKWLELLKEVFPSVRRVAFLLNPATKTSTAQAVHSAAKTLNLRLQEFPVKEAHGFDSAFSAMVKGAAEAVVVQSDAMFTSQRRAIADLAAKRRLPTVGSASLAEAGGLIGYSQDATQNYEIAAQFVDKILRGARAGDLPVRQATNFRLVINLKTADALGVTMPQQLLLRADKVIE